MEHSQSCANNRVCNMRRRWMFQSASICPQWPEETDFECRTAISTTCLLARDHLEDLFAINLSALSVNDDIVFRSGLGPEMHNHPVI